MDKFGPDVIHHFQAKSYGRFFVDISINLQPQIPNQQF